MFNFIKYYKPLHEKALDLKVKIKKADKEKMKVIQKLFIIGIVLMLLIGLVQVLFAIFYKPKTVDVAPPQIEQEKKLNTKLIVLELKILKMRDKDKQYQIPLICLIHFQAFRSL